MADWRARNCVPDSEGEDEGLDDSQEKPLHRHEEHCDDDFVDINAILASEDSIRLSRPSPETIRNVSTQITNSLAVGGGLLQRDEQQDELLAPLLPHLPASVKIGKRPLERLFADDLEPDELGEQPGSPSSSTPAKRLRLASSIATSQPTHDPSSEFQNEWDHASSRVSQPTSPLTALSSVRSTPPGPNIEGRVPEAEDSAGPAHTFDLGKHGQSQRSGALPPGLKAGASTYKFRTRKAIQTRPYTIDDTRYKNTCESHAIPYERFQQPEKAAQDNHDANNNLWEDHDTSIADVGGPSEEAAAHPRPAPGNSIREPIPRAPVPTAKAASLNVPGLTSLDSKFSERDRPAPELPLTSASGASKRRKIAHTYSPKRQSDTAYRRNREQRQRRAAQNTVLQVLQNDNPSSSPPALASVSEHNQESAPGSQPEISPHPSIQFRYPRGFARQTKQDFHSPCGPFQSLTLSQTELEAGQDPNGHLAFNDRDSCFTGVEQADFVGELSPALAVSILADSGEEQRRLTGGDLSEPEHGGRMRLAQDSIVVSDSSDRQAGQATRDRPPVPDWTASESESESEPENRIRKAQRKVRKVLPASWITLNEKKRDAAVNKNKSQNKLRTENESARGTARPILTTDRPSTARSAEVTDILYLDTSASSSAGNEEMSDHPPILMPNRTDVPLILRQASTAIQVDEEDGAFEDNHVDHMLPTSARGPHRKRCSKTRQRKITDTFPGPDRDERRRTDNATRKQRNGHDSEPTLQKQRHRTTPGATSQARSMQALLNNVQVVSRESKVAVRTARVRKAQLLKNRNRPNVRSGLERFWQGCNLRLNAKLSQRSSQDIVGEPVARAGERQPLAWVDGNRQMAQKRTPWFGTTGYRPDLPTGSATAYQAPKLQRNDCPRSKRDQGLLLTNFEVQRTVPARLEVPRVERARLKPLHRSLDPPVERFLQAMPSCATSVRTEGANNESPATRDTATKRRVPRKKIPSRRNLKLTFQDSTLIQTDRAAQAGARSEDAAGDPRTQSQNFLVGLGSYGTDYSVSFDIEPLPDGPCFNSSTLLGNGLVSKCLHMTNKLAVPDSSNVIGAFGDQRWSAWNEKVSSDVQSIFDQIVNGLVFPLQLESSEANGAGDLVERLSAIVRYVAERLFFLDAIDRKGFLCRILDCLNCLVVAISDFLDPANDQPVEHWAPRTFSIPIVVRGLLLAQQCCQIANHDSISTEVKDSADELRQSLLDQTICLVFREGTDDLRLFSQNAMSIVSHAPGIISRIKAEVFVVAIHVIDHAKGRCSSIWKHVPGFDLAKRTAACADVSKLDQQWQSVFDVLPFFDVDEYGKTGDFRRRTDQRQNWEIIKQLIRPVLDIYILHSAQQGPTFNVYLRSILRRCHQLINVWDWYNCEAILSLLFDFFAKINLGSLRNEEQLESPAFLKSLASSPCLDCFPSDKSFHIFLKIVCLGLRKMALHYTREKMASIGYRLIPNHDRRLVKDEIVKQEDLNALRNHHDLLVGLFWALPCGSRIPAHHIERLVDFRHSHKEACRINAKSWANLISYQLSITEESVENLAPFRGWFDQMLAQSVALHETARIEVESFAKSAVRGFGRAISQGSQEAVIRSNQRALEALLCEVLVSFQRIMLQPSTSKAFSMAVPPSMGDVLTLFDPRRPHISTVLDAALNVILAISQRWSELQKSQDIQGLFASLPETIQTALHGLLSDVLGSDTMVHDSLSTKIVDAWVSTACIETQRANKTWDTYIGQHGQLSWSALRDTEQTRRLSPYFYATVAEHHAVYDQYRLVFVTAWFESLVERESLLKFQHRLTMAVLNRDGDDCLLKNLPFARSQDDAHFDVSEDDICERRRQLLSSLFENMREALMRRSEADANRRKREYSGFLSGLMTAMKRNYQSLGPDPNVRDSYVSFAQDVVGLLQHYTAEICPVDRFFLDHRTFPLPDSDPDYVRGKLGNYGLRLRDSGTPKTLSSFLRGICYRAGMEGTGIRLAEQIEYAVTADLASKTSPGDTLLFAMAHAVLPAYITTALDTPCGWILASPLLMSLPATLDTLAAALDGTNSANVDVVQTTIMSLLWHIKRSASPALTQGGSAASSSALHILTTYVAIATAALRPLDYILRLRPTASAIIDMVKYFARLGDFLTFSTLPKLDRSISRVSLDPPVDDVDWRPPASSVIHLDTLALTQNTLRDDLNRDWRYEEGRFCAVRGGSFEPVDLHLGNVDEESLCLVSQCQAFEGTGATMPSFVSLFHGDEDYDF